MPPVTYPMIFTKEKSVLVSVGFMGGGVHILYRGVGRVIFNKNKMAFIWMKLIASVVSYLTDASLSADGKSA